MASSAQSPIQTEYLVNKYIDKIKPKIFIYIPNMVSFTSDGVEGWLFLVNNLEQYDARFLRETISSNNYYLYNALCFNIIDHNLGKPKPVKSKTEYYLGSGCVGFTTILGDTSYYASDYSKKDSCKIPPKQKEAFDRMMKVLYEKKIPVVIAQTPIYQPFFKCYLNPNEIDDYFRSFPGVHYVNFNYNGFDEYDFWDQQHMNSNGVAKFDNMLIDSLRKWKYMSL